MEKECTMKKIHVQKLSLKISEAEIIQKGIFSYHLKRLGKILKIIAASCEPTVFKFQPKSLLLISQPRIP